MFSLKNSITSILNSISGKKIFLWSSWGKSAIDTFRFTSFSNFFRLNFKDSFSLYWIQDFSAHHQWQYDMLKNYFKPFFIIWSINLGLWKMNTPRTNHVKVLFMFFTGYVSPVTKSVTISQNYRVETNTKHTTCWIWFSMFHLDLMGLDI